MATKMKTSDLENGKETNDLSVGDAEEVSKMGGSQTSHGLKRRLCIFPSTSLDTNKWHNTVPGDTKFDQTAKKRVL